MIKIKKSKREIETKERADKVLSLWMDLKRENPDAKKDRIADTIAKEMNLSKPGVYLILKKCGVAEFK